MKSFNLNNNEFIKRSKTIKNNIQCLEKAIKSKRLEKTFETKISEEIYENLRGVIIDKQ